MCGDNGHFSQALEEMTRENKSTHTHKHTVFDGTFAKMETTHSANTKCKIVFEDFLSPIMKNISCD